MGRMKKAVFMLFLVFAWLAASCGPEKPPEALTAFEENGLWGFRDGRGQIVIEPGFQAAYDFHGQIAAVAVSGGWRFVDREGRILDVRPFMTDNGPDDYSEGLSRFVKDGRIGFLDEEGRAVIPAQFDFAAPFSEGLAAFCIGCRRITEGEHASMKGGRWGYIDVLGDMAIKPDYEEVTPFEEGRAKVKLGGRWIDIDRLGKTAGAF